MKAPRVGLMQTLCTRPLVYGLEERDDVVTDTPARIVALFEQGEVDVALVPAVEVARHDVWEILLDCGAVVADGPCRSALLISKTPWAKVKRVALDSASRGSAVLARVLLAKVLAPGQSIQFERMEIRPGTIPDGHDACLVTETRALAWPGYDLTTGTLQPGDPKKKGDPLTVVDVTQSWKEWTGLPFTFAVWMAREGSDIGDWHARLADVAKQGREHLSEIADRHARRLGAPHTPKSVLAYFQNALRFEIGDREIAGLARFLEEAAVLDLVPVMPDRVVMLRPLETLANPVTVSSQLAHAPISVKKAAAAPVDPLQRAREAFGNREYRKALKVIADGEERDPTLGDRPEAALLRGRCEYHLMRWKEAKLNLGRALGVPQTDRLARYLLARIWMDEGRYNRAADMLRGLVVDYPTDRSYRLHAYALLATCVSRKGLEQSAEYFRRTAESGGFTSADLLIEHGEALAKAEMWDEAAAYFGEAVNVDPSNPMGYLRLAKLFYNHNQFLKAEEILAYGLEHNEDEVQFYTLLGDLRRNQQKYTDATTLYRLALEPSPKGYWADYLIMQIADCLYFQGQITEAKSHFMVVARHFRRSKWRKDAEYFAARLNELAEVRPARILVPSIPLATQLQEFAAPKVAAAILAAHGVDNDQRAFAAECFDKGVTWPALRDYFEHYGLKTYAVRGTRELIQKLLDRKLPLVVAEQRGLDGQFVLVVGYDAGKQAVVLYNPEWPTPIDVPWPELEERWRANSGCVLVALPKARLSLVEELDLRDDVMLTRVHDALRAALAGQTERARKTAMEAAALEPDAEAAQKLLVELDLDDAQNAAAIQRCQQVLHKNPKAFWARKHLGDALLANDQLELAVTAYDQAKALYRDESALWWAQGLAYELQAKFIRARQCYQRSLEIEATPQVAMRLAQVLAQLERPFESAYWWEVVQELAPANTEAPHQLSRFDATRDTLIPTTAREKVFAAFVRLPKPPPVLKDEETQTSSSTDVARLFRAKTDANGDLLIDDHDTDNEDNEDNDNGDHRKTSGTDHDEHISMGQSSQDDNP